MLGCTHYGLVTERIVAALGSDVTVFDSPLAVARQTLRRIGLAPDADQPRAGVETILLSGRAGEAPESWRAYPAGTRLLGVDEERARSGGPQGRGASRASA